MKPSPACWPQPLASAFDLCRSTSLDIPTEVSDSSLLSLSWLSGHRVHVDWFRFICSPFWHAHLTQNALLVSKYTSKYLVDPGFLLLRNLLRPTILEYVACKSRPSKVISLNLHYVGLHVTPWPAGLLHFFAILHILRWRCIQKSLSVWSWHDMTRVVCGVTKLSSQDLYGSWMDSSWEGRLGPCPLMPNDTETR